MTDYPPHATGWNCYICDTAVDGLQILNHLESPQHIARGGDQPRPAEVTRRSVLEIRSTDPGGVRRAGTGNGEHASVEESGKELAGKEDKEKPPAEKQILWTCDSCRKTVNISGRDEHLRSEPHRRKAAPRTPAPTKRSQLSAKLPQWHCVICDRGMDKLNEASHLAGKPHLAMARQQPNSTANLIRHRNLEPERLPPPTTPSSTLPSLPAPREYSPYLDHTLPPTRTATSVYHPEASSYCLTCAADFAISTQHLHLSTTPTWTCPDCTTTMHPAARDQHPHSAAHTMALAARPMFYCRACQCVRQLHTKVAHLAGEPHRIKAERHLLEERCYRAPRPTRRCEWMPRHAPPGGVPCIPDVGAAFCVRCCKTVGAEMMESHLRFDCAGDAVRRKIVPRPMGKNKVPPQQNPTPPQRNVPAEPKPTPAKRKDKYKKKVRMDGALYCDVCNAYQAVANIAEHIASTQHQNKVAAQQKPVPSVDATSSLPAVPLGTGPYMSFTGDSFYCSACARSRLVKGIVSHVGSKVHRRNIAAAEAALG